MIYGSFPALKYQRWKNKGRVVVVGVCGGGDWQRIYQYLYRKQHVMVTLIPFPTFYCANHTRGSIRVLPPVENTRLDCH